MIIDTHCHLDIDEYTDVETVICNMKNNIMIASGCNLKTSKRVLELVEKYDNIFGTIGIHPNEISDMTDESLNFIEKNITNPKIVGIGEIGLDYHYGIENKEKQILFFKKQIDLAKKYDKPIVIHSRDSALDTYEILKDNLDNTKAIMHCYGYSYEMALKFNELGVKFGIGGVITFKNAEKLKKVVEKFPLSCFVLETDSPYLSPEPFRGKQNEPKNVFLVAEKIAEIKKVSVDEVIKKTTENACELFDLKMKLC